MFLSMGKLVYVVVGGVRPNCPPLTAVAVYTHASDAWDSQHVKDDELAEVIPLELDRDIPRQGGPETVGL